MAMRRSINKSIYVQINFLECHYFVLCSLAITRSFHSLSAALCKSAVVEPCSWKSRTQLLTSCPINTGNLALSPMTLSHSSKSSICWFTELYQLTECAQTLHNACKWWKLKHKLINKFITESNRTSQIYHPQLLKQSDTVI